MVKVTRNTPAQMLKALIARIMQNANLAFQSFDDLAVATVEGKKPTDAQIRAACADAGLPTVAFASQLETLSKRREAWDAVHARDWVGEQQTAKDELRQTTTDIAAVEQEITALKAELTRLYDQQRRLLGKVNRLTNDEKEARKAMDTTLRQTGAPDDWRSIGEPQPVIRYTPQPGERINIGL